MRDEHGRARTIRFRLYIKTTNPTNGATGNSKLAGIIRSRTRKKHRSFAAQVAGLVLRSRSVAFPVQVTLCRVAPSGGLDPHDGLRASLKGVVDGLADALLLANDRDSRVEWKYDQRRGRPREYVVEVTIESVEATWEPAPRLTAGSTIACTSKSGRTDEGEEGFPLQEDEAEYLSHHAARSKLAAAAPDLARALLEVEWGACDEGHNPACPSCGGAGPVDGAPWRTSGHGPGCALDAALRKAGIR